jgi:hypothetical protein
MPGQGEGAIGRACCVTQPAERITFSVAIALFASHLKGDQVRDLKGAHGVWIVAGNRSEAFRVLPLDRLPNETRIEVPMAGEYQGKFLSEAEVKVACEILHHIIHAQPVSLGYAAVRIIDPSCHAPKVMHVAPSGIEK